MPKHPQNPLRTSRIRDPLPRGYTAKVLAEILRTERAASISGLAKAKPKYHGQPIGRGSISSALKDRRFINPCYGVYGLADDPPLWMDVVRAWNPLNALVLQHLEPHRGTRVAELTTRIKREHSEHWRLTDNDVRVSLAWLRDHGLAFNVGREWARTPLAAERCQPMPYSHQLAYILS